MIHLHQAPIFLEFLLKNLKISKETLVNNFYISGKCNCNQRDCATVILKKRKNSPIDEDRLEIDIQSTKGFIDFHWLSKEYLEIEAIDYKYPFKYEINRLFPKNGKSTRSIPKKTKLQKINPKEYQNLKRYLNNKMSLYEKKLYDGLDFRAIRGQKLFAYVR